MARKKPAPKSARPRKPARKAGATKRSLPTRRAAPGRSRSRAPRRSAASAKPESTLPASRPGAPHASGVTAADIMERDVLTVKPGAPVSEIAALFKLHNIKGAPVVDGSGNLIGIITEDDLVFGQLGVPEEQRDLMASGETPSGPRNRVVLRVAEIMTQNPIAASEDTPMEELCRLMSRLKIHRIPIVRGSQVVGIVSTIDVCRMVAEGQVRVVRT